MFLRTPDRNEQFLKYALVVLGATLILALLFVVIKMNRVSPSPVSTQKEAPLVDESDQTKKPAIEELTGTVISVDTENSFIRVLNDKDGKMYSLAIPPSKGNVGGENRVDISKFSPRDTVSFRLEVLDDTERTDFSVLSFETIGGKELPLVEARVRAE